jgi:hypothetical protein
MTDIFTTEHLFPPISVNGVVRVSGYGIVWLACLPLNLMRGPCHIFASFPVEQSGSNATQLGGERKKRQLRVNNVLQ